MDPFVSNTEPIRVLLVEDEYLISEWVAESLAEQGFAVCTATNGMDALKCLASVPVDILFTDINLAGGMDGTVLARRRGSYYLTCRLSTPPDAGTRSTRRCACRARLSCQSPTSRH
jgi:CheY-like chemotaxis protein